MLKSIVSVGTGLLFLGIGGVAARGAVISNFEAPAYTAAADINGVDGWAKFNAGTSGVVMPDPAGSGYAPPTYPILSGGQSYVHFSSGLYSRGWGSAASAVGEGSTLSWLIRAESASSTSALYFSNNVAEGATPAAIQLNSATDTFSLLGASSPTDTGVSWTPQTTYLLEMELDFASDTFEAFYTNITGGGSRTSLGTKAFALALDAGLTQANGGVFIERNSGAAWYDDISIDSQIPEPTSINILGLGVLVMVMAYRWRGC